MNMAMAGDIETPSGKDAAYENFPVGSRLLPARLRPHVAVFYGFARAIDDIADAPGLTADDKLSRLDGFADALTGAHLGDPAFVKAHRMRDSLAETGVPARHCLDLVRAFKQDAVKGRYTDWDDLLAYCMLSAAPVGRFLLDLHGGSADGYGSSDALCNALQVLNHLQDCKADYLELDRVYLPQDWLAEEGTGVGALAHPVCSPALRKVIDRCLAGVDALLAAAAPLPAGLASLRLAMESAVILGIARRLSARLAGRDPLARRVVLSKWEYLGCTALGALRGALRGPSRTAAE